MFFGNNDARYCEDQRKFEDSWGKKDESVRMSTPKAAKNGKAHEADHDELHLTGI